MQNYYKFCVTKPELRNEIVYPYFALKTPPFWLENRITL